MGGEKNEEECLKAMVHVCDAAVACVSVCVCVCVCVCV